MLLSEKTSEALDILVGQFFNLNRSFDRAVSVMQNKWSMPQAADIIHHRLAHIWPLMADLVSGFKDECNIMTVYPETHADGRDYDNLLDMWQTMLDETIDAYKMIQLTYQIAKEENDLNAVSMLQNLTLKMTSLIGQINTLRDKAELNKIGYSEYDFYISAWGINGVELA